MSRLPDSLGTITSRRAAPAVTRQAIGGPAMEVYPTFTTTAAREVGLITDAQAKSGGLSRMDATEDAEDSVTRTA